jgi:T-complex protein 1 subunit alpha
MHYTHSLTDDHLISAAKTSMASKILGPESDFFAKLAVDAVKSVKMTNSQGRDRYPVGGINILKSHGKSALESALVPGFALNCVRAAQGMPQVVKNAKIALLDIDLKKHR